MSIVDEIMEVLQNGGHSEVLLKLYNSNESIESESLIKCLVQYETNSVFDSSSINSLILVLFLKFSNQCLKYWYLLLVSIALFINEKENNDDSKRTTVKGRSAR